MAFTLHITFSGMCLFVPQPASQGATTGTMHVLMPRMDPSHHHGADRHVPVLSFDPAYLRPGTDIFDEAVTLVPLDEQELALSGQQADIRLCERIVNLTRVTNVPVAAEHLGSAPRKLLSRIQLGAGKMERVSPPTTCWEWEQGKLRPIAHRAEWQITFSEDTLKLPPLTRLDTGSPTPLPELHPRGNRINLNILYIPSVELPPRPEPIHVPAHGFKPSHFATYFRLFGAPVPVRLPVYWGKVKIETECGMADHCTDLDSDMGGTAFTCMLAGVDPQQ